jgi:hypothetical protein
VSAAHLDIDRGASVARKLNNGSDQQGCPERLAVPEPERSAGG